MGAKKTHEQFVSELTSKDVDVDVLEEYISYNTPILCRCRKCGLEWKTRPGNLLHGYGCPSCGIKRRAEHQTKNNNSFVQEMEEINNTVAIKEEYKGARIPIECECVKCGHRWKASPTNLLKGKGCPVCSARRSGDKRRFTQEEFLRTIHSFHPYIDPMEEYRGIGDKIKMKCNSCGYTWETIASVLIRGGGCPRCAGNAIYSHKEFEKKLQEINPSIELIGEYKRSIIPITCKCLRCGNIWESRPSNLLQGKGCPACYHSSTSFLEQVILQSLRITLGESEVLSRNRSAIGKELDVYIPSIQVAIEPGSWKWHQDKLENDKTKRDLCNKSGIRLITIYSDYDGGTPPFDLDCICCKETMGFEGDDEALKKLVSSLFDSVGIINTFSVEQWERIITTAYDRSRRVTTDVFVERVKNIQKDIFVVGEYTGAWNKISCVCKRCGHQWSPAANSLLQGHGCPVCAAKDRGMKNRKTHEQFIDDLSRISPNIDIISKYISSAEKVQCKCIKCGNVWSAYPGNLLKGKGCPSCAKKRD